MRPRLRASSARPRLLSARYPRVPSPGRPRTRSPRLIAAADGVTVFPDAVWNLNPSLAVTGVPAVACIVSPPGAPSTSPPNAILARRMASAETATSFPEAVWRMPPRRRSRALLTVRPNRNSAVSSRNAPRARAAASAEIGVTFLPEAIWKIPAAGEAPRAVSSANRKPQNPGIALAPPPPPSKPASNANPPTSSAASSEGPLRFLRLSGGLSIFSDDRSFSLSDDFSEGLAAGGQPVERLGFRREFPQIPALHREPRRGGDPRPGAARRHRRLHLALQLDVPPPRRGSVRVECVPSGKHPGVLSNAAGVYARVPPSLPPPPPPGSRPSPPGSGT